MPYVIEDSGYLLDYIFQGFFWVDICSIKDCNAISYWTDEFPLSLLKGCKRELHTGTNKKMMC